jgi:uncharacterized sodium:solute symporter family permease YidK
VFHKTKLAFYDIYHACTNPVRPFHISGRGGRHDRSLVYDDLILQAKLRKKNKEETAESYFLAGRSLVWWMVGGSLFASNIGGTQFIGVSGDAAATGIAVVSYEWQVWYTVVIRWSFCCVIYFMV